MRVFLALDAADARKSPADRSHLDAAVSAALLFERQVQGEVNLVVPAMPRDWMRLARVALDAAGSAVRLRAYETPDLATLPAQGHALIQARFLHDLPADLVVILGEDAGDTPCSRLETGAAIARLRAPDVAAVQQVIQAASAILGASSAVHDASRREAAARAAYARMIEGLRRFRLPGRDLLTCAEAIAFNEGPGPRRQLLLDVSVIVHGDARSGIQRVVRSLLLELLRAPPAGVDVRPIHFVTDCYWYADAFAQRMLPSPDRPEEDTVIDARQGDLYLALDLNTHLVDAASDAAFDMLRSRGVYLHFVVYDILLMRHPEWWVPGTADRFAQWLRFIARHADSLVCISEAVAADVRNWIVANPQPRIGQAAAVGSFHLGADVANSAPSGGMPEDAPQVLARISAQTSFLMVGTIEPRKGHAQALAAFEQLWSTGERCQLVIVGRAGWLVDELVARLRSHPELGHRLFWLEGISDEYLEAVYRAGSCLIAASLGEGFGLPLIEAAQHRMPIVARDLPVFREVAGDHVTYFSGEAPADLAQALTRWLEWRSTGTAAPDSSGMRILTWKESARQLMGALGLAAN